MGVGPERPGRQHRIADQRTRDQCREGHRGTRGPTAVRLRLSSDNARVLIEVWDADPRPPAPKDLGEDGTPDPQEEGGRGLFLVAALSTRWDWYLTQEPAGKVVWCELAAEPPEPSEGLRARITTAQDAACTADTTGLGIAPGTVQAHLGRAMATLRDDLIPTRQENPS